MAKRDSGQLSLGGINIDRYFKDFSDVLKLDIGFVYQQDFMWMDRTVDENLNLVGQFKGISSKILAKRIRFIKSMLLLEPYSKKIASKLSGGNKRKLSCAIALLIPPKILFLDEISNGMDPIVRKNLYSYLYSLKNTATFLITHRIDEIEKICDTIAIIVDGKIRDMGDVKSIKERNGINFMLYIEVQVNPSENERDRIMFVD
jgi:ABC-type multidrug transport system ATPase subunit